MGKTVKYVPDGKVLTQFFWDRSPVSIIQGPVGSGTSTACCFKMFRMATEQTPDENGRRASRWVIVRNTFNDLKETTLKTWKFWFEEQALGAMGEVKMTNPPMHHIKWALPDGSYIDAEFIFLALDQEDDVRKLLSMEMTGVWFNEAQFTEKPIFDAAHSRAMQGRYPPVLTGGPTWKGVLCDLNAPPAGHWIPYMRGDVPMPDEWDDDDRRQFICPDNWKFFLQPPGLLEVIKDGRVDRYVENTRENREELALDDLDLVAENTKWLTESYLELVKGKPKTWIDTYVMNRVGIYRKGRPVFESFRPEIHVAKEKIEYMPHVPLIVGIDFARNPAMVCVQVLRGIAYVLAEFGVENYAATSYAPLFKQFLAKRFPQALNPDGGGIQFWGDPSGDSKGQGTDLTPYMIFNSHGMAVSAAPGNNKLSIRLNAVQSQLDKMIDGRPGCLIDPGCITLKAGMGGGYHFDKVKGQPRFHDEPKKDRYADYADAMQYAFLGAGLGFEALNPAGLTHKPVQMRRKKRYSLRR